MSAGLLREAASLMRERAEAATPSPWMSTERHEDKKLGMSVSVAGNLKPADPKVNGARGTADFIASAYGWGPTEANAEHVASWHPAVALAVADWLDSEDTHQFGPTEHAINVARAYLGGAS